MFGWEKVTEKAIDLTKVIFSFIDDSDYTQEEKDQTKKELSKIDLSRIKLSNSTILKSLNLAQTDSISGNKFQSYARPAIIWLFIIMILTSYPIGFLNYFNNNLYLAFIDGMNTFLKLIPSEIYSTVQILGGAYFGFRGLEKITKIYKDK